MAIAGTGLGNAGIGEIAEFERRLSLLEQLVQGKAPANQEIDPATALLIGQGVPQVNGLTLASTAGKVVIRWNASPITDLKRYEVQIATDAAFTLNVETRFTRETLFTWTEGAPAVTYFFRVRTRNIQESVGIYSTVLNGITGEIVTADMASNAITGVSSVRTNVSPLTLNTTDTEVQTITVSTTAGNSVMILGKHILSPNSDITDRTSVSRLKKNGIELYRTRTNFFKVDVDDILDRHQFTVVFLFTEIATGGTATYSMTANRSSAGSGNIVTDDREMVIVEFKA